MNIAVIGKNRINDLLQKECGDYGFSLSVLDKIDAIKSIDGAKGSFKIKSADGIINASYIIVTGEPAPCRYGLLAQKGALTPDDVEEIEELPFSGLPVAFILDYPSESSPQSARKALEQAIRLASKKRRTAILAKNIRTAGGTLESLYRQARRLNVLIFKYDEIFIEYIGGGLFHIGLYGQDGGMELDARTAVFAENPASDGAYERLVKLLRIKTGINKTSNAGNFYLFPTLTSRPGIYFLNSYESSISDDEQKNRISFILTDICRDIWKHSARLDIRDALLNPEGYAEVDAEKCAFCYTCYRTCPHAAMAPDIEKPAMKNLRESCAGCGICFSICPANAITMKGKKERKTVPDSNSLNIYCCGHSGELALKKITQRLNTEGLFVNVTPVSCGGEISVEDILCALKKYGYILIAVCMNDACRHFDGNRRAQRGVERAREILKASGIDENRVAYIQLSHAMPAVLEEYIREIADKSPKGMIL